jgi:hypothetical protein
LLPRQHTHVCNHTPAVCQQMYASFVSTSHTARRTYSRNTRDGMPWTQTSPAAFNSWTTFHTGPAPLTPNRCAQLPRQDVCLDAPRTQDVMYQGGGVTTAHTQTSRRQASHELACKCSIFEHACIQLMGRHRQSHSQAASRPLHHRSVHHDTDLAGRHLAILTTAGKSVCIANRLPGHASQHRLQQLGTYTHSARPRGIGKTTSHWQEVSLTES